MPMSTASAPISMARAISPIMSPACVPTNILADDMGLGKTLQTLAHIQVEKEAGRLDRPVQVLAPVSVLSNWLREAQRFCPGLRCLLLHGAGRHEMAADMAQADVVIAPYSLVQRDRDRWLAQPWHLLVLDEAHHIKNASTTPSAWREARCTIRWVLCCCVPATTRTIRS